MRIPVSDFEDFLAATNDLGEVRNKSRESQDRTIKFYDLQEDIKNKLSEEIGLRKLQEEDRGSLPDVLAVAREVSRVRGEINILEGHMRQLKDLISLTTVTLRVHELNVYVPEHAPEFGTRVERSWKGSLKSLRDFGASCVVWLVAAGPWLVVIGLPVLVSYKVARHRSRRRKKRRASSPSAPPVDDED